MLNDPPTWELGLPRPPRQEDVWGEDRPLQEAASITRRPGELAKQWTMLGGLKQWKEAEDRYGQSLDSPDALELISVIRTDNSAISTTLSSLGRDKTVGLIVHAYLATREMFSAVFANYKPPPVLPKQWFNDLVPSPRRRRRLTSMETSQR